MQKLYAIKRKSTDEYYCKEGYNQGWSKERTPKLYRNIGSANNTIKHIISNKMANLEDIELSTVNLVATKILSIGDLSTKDTPAEVTLEEIPDNELIETV